MRTLQVHFLAVEETPLEVQVKRFWETEKYGTEVEENQRTLLSEEDRKAVTIVQEGTRKLNPGYEVPIPWRTELPTYDDLPYDDKHPVILPSKHPLSDEIIRAFHWEHSHMGTDMVLSQLRQHYWIIQGRGSEKRRKKMCDLHKRKGKAIAPANGGGAEVTFSGI